jgi:NAD(P)-dependent dehydrogenase (short-subunit alcohol dehydrogenase family)
MSNQEFAGRVALVTVASKGIGAGIAKALGQAGANVAVAYAHDHEAAEHVGAEIQAASGSAMAVQCDLNRTEDIEAMIAKTVATFEPIHILFNNAGVCDGQACSASQSIQDQLLAYGTGGCGASRDFGTWHLDNGDCTQPFLVPELFCNDTQCNANLGKVLNGKRFATDELTVVYPAGGGPTAHQLQKRFVDFMMCGTQITDVTSGPGPASARSHVSVRTRMAAIRPWHIVPFSMPNPWSGLRLKPIRVCSSPTIKFCRASACRKPRAKTAT